MRDFVLTKIGEEDKFIEKALSLGFSELVLCYTPIDATKFTFEIKEKLLKSTNLTLFFGILCEKKPVFMKKPLFDMLIMLGTSINSDFLDFTHVYNNEFGKEKDAIHQRRSGLNHVVLAKFHEKNISVLVSITDLNKLSDKDKPIVLGRIKQNIKSCKQANVNYSLISLADSIDRMKSVNDLHALRQLLEQPLK